MSVNLISCSPTTIYIHDGITSTISSSFSAPNSGCKGLAFDGSDLVSSDTSTDKIYIHDGITSTITSSFSPSSTDPGGLTFGGTNLISCHSDKTIYVYDDTSSSVLTSFSGDSNMGGGITGLTYDDDNNNLISCGVGTNRDTYHKICIHDGISSTISTRFDSPDTYPEGLGFNDGNLISSSRGAGAAQGTVYIHDGISSTISSSFTLSHYPYGITIAPTAKPSAPTSLKCEGATNPAGITDKNPELTAVYNHIYGHDGRYYRVQVSRDSNFTDIVWDSEKTRLPTDISKGDTCSPISVGQTLPLDGSKYYWRIKFWDVNDNEGDWSTE